MPSTAINLRRLVTLRANLAGVRPPPPVGTEQTRGQAILSLRTNAADASPQDVELDSRWDTDELVLEVRDRGPGLSAAARARAGKAFFTTKEAGAAMGLGLFLAQAALERLGGDAELRDHEGGVGVVSHLRLPLGPRALLPATR